MLIEFHFIPRTFRLNVFLSTSPKTGEAAISEVDPVRNPRIVGWRALDWEGLRNCTLGWLMFALPNSAISSLAIEASCWRSRRKMPFCLAKNLEYPNRKASAIFGSVGREALKLERGVTSSVFQGSSLTEGNSTWRQSITSFAKMRIAFALSFASSSPGTLKVIRVREGPRMLV